MERVHEEDQAEQGHSGVQMKPNDHFYNLKKF